MRRIRPILLRHARYGLLAAAALLIQAVFLQRLPILGTTAVFLPVVAASVALREDPVASGAWGYVIGGLCDAIVPHSEAYHAVTLMFLCAALAWVCRTRLRPSLPAAIPLTAGLLLFLEFFYFLLFYFIPARAPLSALPGMTVLTAVLSAPLTLIVYPLTRPPSETKP